LLLIGSAALALAYKWRRPDGHSSIEEHGTLLAGLVLAGAICVSWGFGSLLGL
jgi:hypothetical protein